MADFIAMAPWRLSTRGDSIDRCDAASGACRRDSTLGAAPWTWGDGAGGASLRG